MSLLVFIIFACGFCGLYDGCVTGAHEVREDSSGDLDMSVYTYLYYCDPSNNQTREEDEGSTITWKFYNTRDEYSYDSEEDTCYHSKIEQGDYFGCQICLDDPKLVPNKRVEGGNRRLVNGNNATFWQSIYDSPTEGKEYTFFLFESLPKYKDVRPISSWTRSDSYGMMGSATYSNWAYYGDKWGGDPNVWVLPEECKKAELSDRIPIKRRKRKY